MNSESERALKVLLSSTSRAIAKEISEKEEAIYTKTWNPELLDALTSRQAQRCPW